MTTVQCPSCGANATNLSNCEFCGSLFVRYSNLDISTANILSQDGKVQDFIFPGLEQQLRENISLQTSNDKFIVTDIIQNSEVILQIIASSPVIDAYEGEHKGSYPGLTIDLPFPEYQQNEYKQFMAMDEHKFFFHRYDGHFHEYYIDFGNDPVGTAYLVSKILIYVLGVSKDTLLNYKTSEYPPAEDPDAKNSGVISQKKGKCFVATATMGDYNHPVVIDLRNFRDDWILHQKWGSSFVKWYYRYGPYFAEIIEDRKIVRAICYITIIKPLHIISQILNRRF